MKFGERLISQRIVEWRHYYINYIRLKRLVKEMLRNDAPPEIFLKELQSNFFVASEFYNKREDEIRRKIRKFINDGGFTHQASTTSLGTKDMLEKRRQELCQELFIETMRLEDFADLNCVALRKIAKKYDKMLIQIGEISKMKRADPEDAVDGKRKFGRAQSTLLERGGPDACPHETLESDLKKTLLSSTQVHISNAKQRLEPLREVLEAHRSANSILEPLLRTPKSDSKRDEKISMKDVFLRHLPSHEEKAEKVPKFWEEYYPKVVRKIKNRMTLILVGTITSLLCFWAYKLNLSPDLNFESYFTVVITVLVLYLLVSGSAPADGAMIAATLILQLAGVLDMQEAWGGFSNDVVLSVGVLGIVAVGIQNTGSIELVFLNVLGKPKTLTRAYLRLLLPACVLNVCVSNTACMAILLPVIEKWAESMNRDKVLFYLPLSYCLIISGTTAIFATSSNLVAQGLLKQKGYPEFSQFEIAPVALTATFVTVVMLVLLSPIVLRKHLHEESDSIDNEDSAEEYGVLSEKPQTTEDLENKLEFVVPAPPLYVLQENSPADMRSRASDELSVRNLSKLGGGNNGSIFSPIGGGNNGSILFSPKMGKEPGALPGATPIIASPRTGAGTEDPNMTGIPLEVGPATPAFPSRTFTSNTLRPRNRLMPVRKTLVQQKKMTVEKFSKIEKNEKKFVCSVQVSSDQLNCVLLGETSLIEWMPNGIDDVVSIEHLGDTMEVSEEYQLSKFDILTCFCQKEALVKITRDPNLGILCRASGELRNSFQNETGLEKRELVEVVLGALNPLLGKTLPQVVLLMKKYSAYVIAARPITLADNIFHAQERAKAIVSPKDAEKFLMMRTESLREFQKAENEMKIKLQVGDSLILEVPSSFFEDFQSSHHFALCRKVQKKSEDTNEHIVSTRNRFFQIVSVIILLCMILLVSTSILELLPACMSAAFALIFTRCLTVEQAINAVKLRTLLSIVGAFGLGAAVQKTQVASVLAHGLTTLLAPLGEPGLLAAIFLITVALGIVFHATAVVVLILPVAIECSGHFNVPVHRTACMLMIGAGCLMLSPISYQTNLMAYTAAAYEFNDFPKIGFPIVLLIGACAVPASMLFIHDPI